MGASRVGPMTRIRTYLALAALLAAGTWLLAGEDAPQDWEEAWRRCETRMDGLDRRLADLERLLEGNGAGEAEPPVEVAKRVYMDRFVELDEVEARYVHDLVSGKVAAVFGKIRNRGKRTIRRIRLTASFFDAQGNPIHEDSYEPVAAATPDTDAPLKPRYVRRFGFKAEMCPPEWAEGRVEIVIADIEFDD